MAYHDPWVPRRPGGESGPCGLLRQLVLSRRSDKLLPVLVIPPLVADQWHAAISADLQRSAQHLSMVDAPQRLKSCCSQVRRGALPGPLAHNWNARG